MRISRDEMFMKIAHVVAERGTCPRAKVGAVLVNRYNTIVSIGYNGQPAGQPHCDETGCRMEDDHCTAIHAEVNAISKYLWIIGTGPYVLYVTHMPCKKCKEAILNCGTIERVVYDIPYRYEGPDSFTEGGVLFERYQRPWL